MGLFFSLLLDLKSHVFDMVFDRMDANCRDFSMLQNWGLKNSVGPVAFCFCIRAA